MIITIDGPAGSGKTTVAKALATRLGFTYVDTGAMYRALTYLVITHKIDLSNLESLKRLLKGSKLTLEKGTPYRYFANGEDVTEKIRSEEVTAKVSEVAALAEVRDHLYHLFRAYGAQGRAVFEGRDMGSVVFPEAELKIFLQARPEVRAQRRRLEMTEAMENDKVLQQLQSRDEKDATRKIAPLVCPEGAYQIDTTHLTIEEVVETIVLRIP